MWSFHRSHGADQGAASEPISHTARPPARSPSPPSVRSCSSPCRARLDAPGTLCVREAPENSEVLALARLEIEDLEHRLARQMIRLQDQSDRLINSVLSAVEKKLTEIAERQPLLDWRVTELSASLKAMHEEMERQVGRNDAWEVKHQKWQQVWEAEHQDLYGELKLGLSGLETKINRRLSQLPIGAGLERALGGHPLAESLQRSPRQGFGTSSGSESPRRLEVPLSPRAISPRRPVRQTSLEDSTLMRALLEEQLEARRAELVAEVVAELLPAAVDVSRASALAWSVPEAVKEALPRCLPAAVSQAVETSLAGLLPQSFHRLAAEWAAGLPTQVAAALPPLLPELVTKLLPEVVKLPETLHKAALDRALEEGMKEEGPLRVELSKLAREVSASEARAAAEDLRRELLEVKQLSAESLAQVKEMLLQRLQGGQAVIPSLGERCDQLEAQLLEVQKDLEEAKADLEETLQGANAKHNEAHRLTKTCLQQLQAELLSTAEELHNVSLKGLSDRLDRTDDALVAARKAIASSNADMEAMQHRLNTKQSEAISEQRALLAGLPDRVARAERLSSESAKGLEVLRGEVLAAKTGKVEAATTPSRSADTSPVSAAFLAGGVSARNQLEIFLEERLERFWRARSGRMEDRLAEAEQRLGWRGSEDAVGGALCAITQLEEQLHLEVAKIRGLEGEAAASRQRVDTLAVLIESSSQRQDALEEQQRTTLTSLETRLGTLETSTHGVSQDVHETAARLEEAHADLERHKDASRGLSEELPELELRLRQFLEVALADLRETVHGSVPVLQKQEELVKEVEERLSTIEEWQRQLSTGLGECFGAVEEKQRALSSDLAARLSFLESQLSSEKAVLPDGPQEEGPEPGERKALLDKKPSIVDQLWDGVDSLSSRILQLESMSSSQQLPLQKHELVSFGETSPHGVAEAGPTAAGPERCGTEAVTIGEFRKEAAALWFSIGELGRFMGVESGTVNRARELFFQGTEIQEAEASSPGPLLEELSESLAPSRLAPPAKAQPASSAEPSRIVQGTRARRSEWTRSPLASPGSGSRSGRGSRNSSSGGGTPGGTPLPLRLLLSFGVDPNQEAQPKRQAVGTPRLPKPSSSEARSDAKASDEQEGDLNGIGGALRGMWFGQETGGSAASATRRGRSGSGRVTSAASSHPAVAAPQRAGGRATGDQQQARDSGSDTTTTTEAHPDPPFPSSRS